MTEPEITSLIKSSPDNLWDKTWNFIRFLEKIGYFKIEISGLENIPKHNNYIFVANHSGWIAWDAVMCAYALRHALPQQLPKVFINELLYELPIVGDLMREEANGATFTISKKEFHEYLKQDVNHLPVAIFPEGEEGNCKPFWKAYQMQKWKRGAYYLAKKLDAPLIPIAIIGNEEAAPVAFQVKAFKKYIGTVFPIPMLPFLLPSRYKLIFGKPVYLEKLSDLEEVRRDLQLVIDKECQYRPLHKFSKNVKKIKKFIYG